MDPETLTIHQIISNMRPSQLWAAIGSVIGLLVGAFFLGQYVAKLIAAATHNALSAKITNLEIELAKANFKLEREKEKTFEEPTGMSAGSTIISGLASGNPPDQVVKRLKKYSKEGEALLDLDNVDAEYERWRKSVETYLKRVFMKKPGTVQPSESFDFGIVSWRGPDDKKGDVKTHLAAALGVIDGIIEELSEDTSI